MSTGDISSKAAGTAYFIEMFDKLFDMLNSCTWNIMNNYKKPYTASEEQTTFLLHMLDTLRDMEVYKISNKGKDNVTKMLKSLKCFQITIMSIMSLWEDVQKEGCKELCTRRLNQDCLENFFGKIRQQGGSSVNPTPIQFIRAFRKLFAADLLKRSDTFNCLPDVNTLLLQMPPNIDVYTLEKTEKAAMYKVKTIHKFTIICYCLIIFGPEWFFLFSMCTLIFVYIFVCI